VAQFRVHLVEFLTHAARHGASDLAKSLVVRAMRWGDGNRGGEGGKRA
jgi:hypothetical protein